MTQTSRRHHYPFSGELLHLDSLLPSSRIATLMENCYDFNCFISDYEIDRVREPMKQCPANAFLNLWKMEWRLQYSLHGTTSNSMRSSAPSPARLSSYQATASKTSRSASLDKCRRRVTEQVYAAAIETAIRLGFRPMIGGPVIDSGEVALRLIQGASRALVPSPASLQYDPRATAGNRVSLLR
jgi:hypothetical protein